MTQKQLADEMKTTQQTVARWENGKPEPSLEVFRELAMVFHTNCNALIGKSFFNGQSSMDCDYFHVKDTVKGKSEATLSGFWGHLGLLGEHMDKSIWYPITEDVMDSSFCSFQQYKFILVPCLDNKLLVVNKSHLKRWVFLDEACDSFPNDWELEWYQTGEYPLELFTAFEDLAYSEAELDKGTPLMKEAEQIVEEQKLDEDDLFALTLQTRVVYADGKKESYCIDDYDAVSSLVSNLMDYPEDEDLQDYIHFPTDGSEDVFVNLNNVSVIEFPFLKVDEYLTSSWEEEEKEMKSDSALED